MKNPGLLIHSRGMRSYHALFQRLLRQRLAPQKIRSTLRRLLLRANDMVPLPEHWVSHLRAHRVAILSAITIGCAMVIIVRATLSAPHESTTASAHTKQPARADTNNQIERYTIIAIDAGHGGIDPGAIGKNGLMEKDVTLHLAKAVRDELRSVDKLHVALTRHDDSTININNRTDIIERIGADFVLSLHLNALPQKHITLVESYYKVNRRLHPEQNQFYIKSSDRNIEISRALASAVQSEVFNTVKRHNPVSVNAGLKTDSMRILSQNTIPGALIEVTCLSNPEEEKRLTDSTYVDKLALAIANGIKHFLQTRDGSVTAAYTPATVHSQSRAQ